VNKALKTRLEIPKSMALTIKTKIMAISDSCGILMERIVVINFLKNLGKSCCNYIKKQFIVDISVMAMIPASVAKIWTKREDAGSCFLKRREKNFGKSGFNLQEVQDAAPVPAKMRSATENLSAVASSLKKDCLEKWTPRRHPQKWTHLVLESFGKNNFID
jgi:hypothetical protein